MVNSRRLLFTISFHHLCNDGTLMALVALVPVLVDEMDLSYYDVGILGFGLLITVVVQYGVGRIADRAFSRYLLEIGAGLMGLSFLLLLLVNDFVGLFTVVIVMRVGAAFYHPVGTSWITRAYGGAYLETALGVQSGIGNVGVIVALGSSGFLAEAYGWKLPCMLWAALNLSAVILGLTLVEETGIKADGKRTAKRTSAVHTFRKIGILAVPIVTGGALYQVTSYFGPLRLMNSGEWSAGSADLVFALWIGVGAVTSYYFGVMSSRFGKRNLLRFGYMISAVSVILLAFFSDWYIVGGILIAYGLLLFTTYPALFSLISDATEEHERGTAFGILFGLQLGGGAATVYLSGFLADRLSDPAYAFWIVFVLALMSIISLEIWDRRALNVRGA